MSELAQVAFSLPSSAAEALSNLLTEEGGGVEQRDRETQPTLEDGRTELLVWMPTSDVARRVAQAETLLGALRELAVAVDPWSWRSEEVDPASWHEAYKRYFTPHRLSRRFVVKPSWESYEAQPLDLVIEMDPGMAFGTGLHASTKLVVHALERVARSGPAPQAVLDLGCGTGILAIAAARLWSGARIVAIDNDESAVQVCKENVRRNGLEGRIHIEHKSAAKLDGRYNLVLANLNQETLSEIQPRMRKLLDTYGRLVLSGLLAEQTLAVTLLYTRDLAMEPEFSEEIDGWRAVLLRVRD